MPDSGRFEGTANGAEGSCLLMARADNAPAKAYPNSIRRRNCQCRPAEGASVRVKRPAFPGISSSLWVNKAHLSSRRRKDDSARTILDKAGAVAHNGPSLGKPRAEGEALMWVFAPQLARGPAGLDCSVTAALRGHASGKSKGLGKPWTCWTRCFSFAPAWEACSS